MLAVLACLQLRAAGSLLFALVARKPQTARIDKTLGKVVRQATSCLRTVAWVQCAQ